MKKLFYVATVLVLGMVAFSSCSDNDDDDKKGPETGDVTQFNELRMIQNSFVRVDSTGKYIERIKGRVLDRADTTRLFVGVRNVEAAEKMFNQITSVCKTRLATPTGEKVTLKDNSGKEMGMVIFDKKTDLKYSKMDILAEVTFSPETPIKHFSKVEFVNETQMPVMSAPAFYVGDFVKMNTAKEGMQNWVCIRANTSSVKGMLVYLSESTGTWGVKYIQNFADPSDAQEASNVLKADWDKFGKYFTAAGRNLRDNWYWINDWFYYVAGGAVYAINLKRNDIDWFDVVWKNPNHHYMQVSYFGDLN